MALDCCYFCGFADDTALSEHHVIPKSVDPVKAHGEQTVTVCRNCHKKVHDVVDPVIDYMEQPGMDEAEPDEEKLSNRVTAVKNAVDAVSAETDAGGAPIASVHRHLVRDYDDVDDAGEAIEKARHAGEIYEPQTDVLRTL